MVCVMVSCDFRRGFSLIFFDSAVKSLAVVIIMLVAVAVCMIIL